MSLPGGKGVALGRSAGRGGGFGADAVLGECGGVIARRGGFVGISCAVMLVIDIEHSGRGHRQQRSQLGTADAAQDAVCEAREELVMIFVGRRPPAGILVVAVLCRAHDVERHYGHHAIRTNGPRIAGSEVCRSDKRVDAVHRSLRTADAGDSAMIRAAITFRMVTRGLSGFSTFRLGRIVCCASRRAPAGSRPVAEGFRSPRRP